MPVMTQMVNLDGLEVRPVDHGWEILCPPGPLARFLLEISGGYFPTPISFEFREGLPYMIIPYTSELDQAIERLVHSLIDLRYKTGRVQLELWGNL